MKILRNEPIAPFVYYRLGGPCEKLVFPDSNEDVLEILDRAHAESAPLWVVGSGSNLLIRDGGLPGYTLYVGAHLPAQPEVLFEDARAVRIRVPGFMGKARLLEWALDQGLKGLEFSAGIPGTMGGAVFMNAGTKWGSYAECIEFVTLYSAAEGRVRMSREELGFKYRGLGEGILGEGRVVLEVELALKKAQNPLDFIKLVDEILSYRGQRQPLELPSCGSVFKNPEPPQKGAGRLIEAAGLKGTRIGGAQVSNQHANFIQNLGTAKSSDVESLIVHCQQEVLKKFGVGLQPEVLIWGRPIPA